MIYYLLKNLFFFAYLGKLEIRLKKKKKKKKKKVAMILIG